MSQDVMSYSSVDRIFTEGREVANVMVTLLNGLDTAIHIRKAREADYFLGTKETVERVFNRSELYVHSVDELANQYWPESLLFERLISPWWAVKTRHGVIKIGRRKRVIEIVWQGTQFRGHITTDDVTQEDYLVHAWTENKMFEYLKALAYKLNGYHSGIEPKFVVTGIDPENVIVD